MGNVEGKKRVEIFQEVIMEILGEGGVFCSVVMVFVVMMLYGSMFDDRSYSI